MFRNNGSNNIKHKGKQLTPLKELFQNRDSFQLLLNTLAENKPSEVVTLKKMLYLDFMEFYYGWVSKNEREYKEHEKEMKKATKK